MANLNLNKVVLAGRLTNEPELKQTQSGISVVTTSIAVNRRFVKQTEGQESNQPTADFINIVAWRQTAEFICKYFRKGKPICVVGSIQVRSYTDQQGNKRYATEVVADEANFIESKSDSTYGGAPAFAGMEGDVSRSAAPAAPAYSAPAVQPAAQPAAAPKFEEISGDDDLPF